MFCIKYRMMLLSLMLFISVTGCGQGLFMSEEKAKKDWEEYEDFVGVTSIEQDVLNELKGKRPPGGATSWNAYWLGFIKGLEKDLKDRKYVSYIIMKRHNEGLPPIEGYDYAPKE